MRFKSIAVSTIIVFMGAAAGAFGEELKVTAGGAFIENLLTPIEAPFEAKHAINLIPIEKGAKFGTLSLENGEMDAMGAGLTFEDWQKLVAKEAIVLKDPSVYRHVVVGQDRVAVAVNKKNPVAALDKNQLKGIFTGKITNWQEVGGPNMPVIIIWIKFTPGPNNLFIQKMMDGEAPTKEAIEINFLAEAKQTLLYTPEAIMVYPSAVQDPELNFPKVPEMTRPYIVITKGAPAPKVQKLIDFITGEGRKFIK